MRIVNYGLNVQQATFSLPSNNLSQPYLTTFANVFFYFYKMKTTSLKQEKMTSFCKHTVIIHTIILYLKIGLEMAILT